MDGLVEVRSSNNAFEMRHGQIVEFATDEVGQTRRLRSLGCPEYLIKGVVACAKRTRNRKTARPYLGDNSKEVARLAALNAERCRKNKPLTRDERIARATAAVKADIPFLNNCTEKERQQRKDDELRERMEAVAGITNRRRKYQPN